MPQIRPICKVFFAALSAQNVPIFCHNTQKVYSQRLYTPFRPVSYTHLDVYKRQAVLRPRGLHPGEQPLPHRAQQGDGGLHHGCQRCRDRLPHSGRRRADARPHGLPRRRERRKKALQIRPKIRPDAAQLGQDRLPDGGKAVQLAAGFAAAAGRSSRFGGCLLALDVYKRQNLIREGKCYQIPSVLQSGAALGMHSLNADLARLVSLGRITRDTALRLSLIHICGRAADAAPRADER